MVGKQLLNSKTDYSVNTNPSNIKEMVNLVTSFASESDWKLFDAEHVKKLFEAYLYHPDGVVITLDQGNHHVGIICGIVQQHMYDLTKVVLVEMAWYVFPEHRKTLKNIKLLKEFEKVGKEKGAEYIFMTLKSNMKDVEHLYTRLGYKETEKTFMRKI
jgi:hypothetical protein